MGKEKWDDVIKFIDILKLSIYGATAKTYENFHRGKLKYVDSMQNILGFLEYADKNRPYTIGLFVVTDLNRDEKDLWLQMWEPRLDEVFIWEPHNWIEGRSYRKVNTYRQETCGRPANGPMYIHADGTVGPCCWDLHKEIPLGNLRTQTMEEIYCGEPYEKLRYAHRKKDFSNYICRKCDQTNFNPTVLIFASNDKRRVGQITSNMADIVEHKYL